MENEICRKCQTLLISGSNWYASSERNRTRICKGCQIARVRENQKASASWSDYVVRYRSEKLDEIRKHGRERHRRVYVGEVAERSRERNRAWYRDNKPEASAIRARRRARLKGSERGGDPSEIAKVYALASALTERFGVPYHVDHLMPLAKGGSHHQDNLVVMRADWNIAKGSRVITPLITFFAPR